MKNTKHLLIVSAVLLLLSSCGSLSISQKRYSRGLNIDWFAGKDDKKPVNTSSKKPSKIEVAKESVNTPQSFDHQSLAQTPYLICEKSPAVVLENATSDVIQPTAKVKITPIDKHEPLVNLEDKASKESKLRHAKQVLKAAKKADADVSTLILVILAIFVPPLAVFLYFMEFNGQFWLNILLVVLAALLWPISKLLILAAVIHAIMVVLGMLG